MISWTVVGHTARAIHAASLARNLKAQLVMDDGTLGADANHLRAWAIEPHPNANWVGVLEDDAQPVAGFAEQVDVALAAAPTDIVSLYLGTGRPLRWQERMAHATDQSDEDGAHWITSTHLLHAVAGRNIFPRRCRIIFCSPARVSSGSGFLSPPCCFSVFLSGGSFRSRIDSSRSKPPGSAVFGEPVVHS